MNKITVNFFDKQVELDKNFGEVRRLLEALRGAGISTVVRDFDSYFLLDKQSRESVDMMDVIDRVEQITGALKSWSSDAHEAALSYESSPIGFVSAAGIAFLTVINLTNSEQRSESKVGKHREEAA